MAGAFAGIVSILDWVKDKLPIQDRKERWKNEIENLKKEREQIKKGVCNAKTVKRLNYINTRIDYLDQLFRNADKG